MALKKRKRHQRAFEHAFEMVNLLSGHVISWNDDGCDKSGNPGHQRTSCFRKIDDMRDVDGDPVFALPGEVPDFIRGPLHDGRAQRKLSTALAKLSDPSRNPKYKTLGDKAKANKKAHEEREREQAANSIFGSRMPPAIQAMMDSMAAAVAANTKPAKPSTGAAA